jgi:two-component system, cell cycle sensor histidine kinase and response regulator CckA
VERKTVAELRTPGTEAGQSVVLIVDDEANVRGILERSLADKGYQMLVAGSADEAVELVSARKVRLNLAMIDVSLAGTDGPALAGLLRRSQPGLPVLFVSGYGDAQQRQVLGEPLLAKPFNPDDLARCVREMLATGRCEECVPVGITRRA